MANTRPRTWEGNPSLTDKTVDTIKELYASSLRDEDQSSSIDDGCWYWGYRSACEEILDMLYEREEVND